MCVGSRSALIMPLTTGNWTRRDPDEDRGASREEDCWKETWEGTLNPANLSTKRQQIANLAKQKPGVALYSLHHFIDMNWMREAYQLTRKDGAPGVDGQTAADFAKNLEANLLDLMNRIKSGRYVAPPVRRTYIPKADGSQRPLGIPCFEDKVAQRVIVMLLEPIYENDFHDFSYGFRPERSCHGALQALREAIMRGHLQWVVDIDISKFFDTLQHDHLRSFLDQRVTDGVVRRMIDKWLKAGVLEDGALHHAEEGSPQGGVVSPLLANVYLHYVLDEWYAKEVEPRLWGKGALVRYADDCVMAFERLGDAKRVLTALGKRLERFGLKLHPKKTRLIDFRRRRPNGGHVPETDGTNFDFLGFTHVWGKFKKHLRVVFQVTAKSRYARALAAVTDWCRENRHLKTKEQHEHLCRMVKGHYNYYGVTGNDWRLSWFANQIERTWRKWLSRRNREGLIPWKRFHDFLKRHPLPRPQIVHKHPYVYRERISSVRNR